MIVTKELLKLLRALWHPTPAIPCKVLQKKLCMQGQNRWTQNHGMVVKEGSWQLSVLKRRFA